MKTKTLEQLTVDYDKLHYRLRKLELSNKRVIKLKTLPGETIPVESTGSLQTMDAEGVARTTNFRI